MPQKRSLSLITLVRGGAQLLGLGQLHGAVVGAAGEADAHGQQGADEQDDENGAQQLRQGEAAAVTKLVHGATSLVIEAAVVLIDLHGGAAAAGAAAGGGQGGGVVRHRAAVVEGDVGGTDLSVDLGGGDGGGGQKHEGQYDDQDGDQRLYKRFAAGAVQLLIRPPPFRWWHYLTARRSLLWSW